MNAREGAYLADGRKYTIQVVLCGCGFCGHSQASLATVVGCLGSNTHDLRLPMANAILEHILL